MFGTSIAYEQVHSFDMGTVLGIDPKTLQERVYTFVHLHHFLMEPVQGVREALIALVKYYNLQIVTSRCESIEYITTGWLDDNSLSKYFSALHFTNSSYSAYPDRKRTKAEVCANIRAVALIDDGDHNALEVAETQMKVLRLKKPWNGRTEHQFIKDVHSWDEIKRRLLVLV